MISTIGKVTAQEANDRFDAISRITEELEPEMQTEFRRVVNLLASALGVEMFLEALGRGDVDGAYATLAAIELRGEFIDRFRPIFEKAVAQAGFQIGRIEGRTGFYEPQQPRAIRLIERHSSRLVTQITTETRQSIRNSLARAVESGENPRVAARRLRGTVGLIDKHARAVDRMYRSLVDSGVSQARALRQSREYAGRLLTWRTETIARTEMLWSANAGQQQYWEQLADAGIIDRSTIQRVWVAALDDRTCPQCWPMDGVVVETLESRFESSMLGRAGETLQPRDTGSVFVDFPPLHPNCRCTTVLQ